MRIEQVNPADYIERVMPLLAENKQETEAHVRGEIRPDVGLLNLMHGLNGLICLAAFDDSDEVVGYAMTVLTHTHPHYKDLKCASNSVLFVRSDCRSTGVGLKLMSYTRRLAREAGAKVLTWHAKPGTAMDMIMQRSRRARLEELTYSEEL